MKLNHYYWVNKMKNKNIPEIRFKGFSEAWEQRKLKDIANYIDGNYGENYPKEEEFVDFGIPFFTSAVIGTEGIWNYKFVKYITEDKNIILKKAQSKGTDIILTNRGASMGVVCQIPRFYQDVNIGPQLTRIRGNKEVLDNLFLLSQLKTKRCQENLLASNAGSAMPFISILNLGNLDIVLPKLEEQKKVGEFLKNLDNLITLHQRKYDKLKELKISLLEKMFPKNNEKVPNVRFKGFTEAWEQSKLEEISNIFDGTHQTPDYKNEGIMFLSVENIKNLQSNKYISNEDFKKNFKIFPQKNDILMTRIGDIGTTNIVKDNSPKAYYVSLALIKPINISSYFLNQSIKSLYVQKELKERSLLTAIPMKINKDQIGKINILYPKDIKEQQSIGLLFDKLDNLITLHQRKLDKFKNIKKALLEKMFI